MDLRFMKNRLNRAVKLTQEKLSDVSACKITANHVDVTGFMNCQRFTFRVYNDRDTLYRVYDDGTMYPES